MIRTARPREYSLPPGLTVLVVEDEAIVSILFEDVLMELGCTDVRLAGRVSDALTMLREQRFDAAVLDVNVAGEPVYPVAARLVTGRVPFVFATGYGTSGIPAEWARIPVVQKPFATEALARALHLALHNRPNAP